MTEHDASASPRASQVLMQITQLVGAAGLAWGLAVLIVDGGASAIEPVAAVAVGAMGVVSFIRHSVFHRSDAARMKWDIGRRNEFQIEVGFANLAWGVLALAAVVWDWGTAAQAALAGVFGLYLVLAAALLAQSHLDASAAERRSLAPAVSTGVVGLLLLFFCLAALVDARIAPF